MDSALALACQLSKAPPALTAVPGAQKDGPPDRSLRGGAAARSCLGKEMVALGPWAE